MRVGGARLTPPMGLTSWATFMGAGDGVMVMGDMVLEEGQVSPVMSAALDAGLEVTALHNHFLWDSPRVMFMHIGGHGSVEHLAGAVGKVLARDKEAGTPLPQADIDPAQTQHMWDLMARMRREQPVNRPTEGFVYVASHADNKAVFRDAKRFSSAEGFRAPGVVVPMPSRPSPTRIGRMYSVPVLTILLATALRRSAFGHIRFLYSFDAKITQKRESLR